jgi:hypothetical protein
MQRPVDRSERFSTGSMVVRAHGLFKTACERERARALAQTNVDLTAPRDEPSISDVHTERLITWSGDGHGDLLQRSSRTTANGRSTARMAAVDEWFAIKTGESQPAT